MKDRQVNASRISNFIFAMIWSGYIRATDHFGCDSSNFYFIDQSTPKHVGSNPAVVALWRIFENPRGFLLESVQIAALRRKDFLQLTQHYSFRVPMTFLFFDNLVRKRDALRLRTEESGNSGPINKDC